MNKGIGSLMGESGRTVSDMDRRIADLGASQGMAPAEQRMMLIQKTAADMGRNISDRDAQLFGMGEISFEEAMSRSVAGPGVGETMGQFSDELRRIGKTEKGFSDFSDNIVNLVQSGQMSQEDAQNLLSGNTERFIGSSERGELQPFQGLNMSNSPRTRQGLRDSVIQSRNELQQQQLGFAKGGEAFPDLTGDGQVTQADILKGRGVFAEGDEVSRETNEIEAAMADVEGVQPETQVIQQVMTMVMELVQSGASEEEIVAALRQMGLDDEDIQAVFQMLEEQMQSQQDPIQSELSQMM